MRIFVGLSGGVDSSVVAKILLDQGHEVVGVFIKNWSKPINGLECSVEADYWSAKTVANYLGIKLLQYDFETEYLDLVVRPMIKSYAKGITPNPDVLCNRYIKFDLFLNKALQDEADCIATGHYVRLVNNYLHRAFDKKKDQSYFLAGINPETLKNSIFPLGELDKSKVRELASQFGLPTAKRPDSQGLCFVGKIPLRDFLSQYLPSKKGPIIDIHSQAIIGEHQGSYYYTIGQRQGLGIGGQERPHYVVKVDTVKNTIYVSSKDEDLLQTRFNIGPVNYFDANFPLEKSVVQLRHRSSPIKITKLTGHEVVLDTPERAIAPGQLAAFYDQDRLIASATIV